MVNRSKPTLSKLKKLADHEVLLMVGLDVNGCAADWRPWHKPSRPLPIDNAVDALLQRQRHPKVPQSRRLKTDLCPYFAGRFFVALATINARMEEAEWDETFKLRLVRLSSIAKHSLAAKKQIDQLMKTLHGISFSSSPAPIARLDRSDGKSSYAAIDFLQAVHGDLDRALTDVCEGATSTSSNLKDQSRRGDYQVWHAAFAFRIGQLWFSLFEDAPGTQNDGPFVKLIASAFETVCSDKDLDWNRAKTNAFKRHDVAGPDDGFDRYVARGGHPARPSNADIVATQREHRERLKAISAKNDEELREIKASFAKRNV